MSLSLAHLHTFLPCHCTEEVSRTSSRTRRKTEEGDCTHTSNSIDCEDQVRMNFGADKNKEGASACVRQLRASLSTMISPASFLSQNCVCLIVMSAGAEPAPAVTPTTQPHTCKEGGVHDKPQKGSSEPRRPGDTILQQQHHGLCRGSTRARC